MDEIFRLERDLRPSEGVRLVAGEPEQAAGRERGRRREDTAEQLAQARAEPRGELAGLGARADVLPDDRRANRIALAVEQDEGGRVAGGGHTSDLLRSGGGIHQGAPNRRRGGGPDRLDGLLDPAGVRAAELERRARLARRTAPLVEQGRPAAGRADVQAEEEASHRAAYFWKSLAYRRGTCPTSRTPPST